MHLRIRKQKHYSIAGWRRALLCLALVLAAFGVVSFTNRSFADISDGLVAHYTFDDISGSTAPDSSGNGNNGTINGASTVAGKSGSALSFDGDDDDFDIQHQLISSADSDFTYSFFVQADVGGDDNQQIAGQASSGTNNNTCFALVYDQENTTIKALATNNANTPTITREFDLSGKWNHVTVVNSESEGESRLYVNGIIATGDDATCSQPLATQFLFGRAHYTGYNMQFTGLLDDVRVYDRALTNEEVSELASEFANSTISITTPADGATVQDSVTIESSVGGSSATTSVQYYIDGEATGAPVTTPPYSYEWDTSAVEQGTYPIVAVATNEDGDEVPSQVVSVFVDKDPSAELVAARRRAQTSAEITWVASEAVTGRVEYGLTDSYGSQTSLDSTSSLYHSQTLSGLTPNTTYHYRVVMTDANNNTVNSSDQTFTTLTSATGNEWHVTPDGTSGGDGSEGDPWDLATALSGIDEIEPGDTIWVHGGTYSGIFSSAVAGTEAAPVLVRNYNNERAIIDGGDTNGSWTLNAYGNNVWYWGLEIMSSAEDRLSAGGSNPGDLDRAYGLNIFGDNNRFINNVIHDTAQGMGLWTASENSEAYGNIIYYNGWEGPSRGHGHGLYTQNDTGMKDIADNVILSGFAYGVHAYTEGGSINNILLDGNTIFENGQLSDVTGYATNILMGGLQISENPMIFNNQTYYNPDVSNGTALDLGYDIGCDRPTVRNNALVAYLALAVSYDCPNKTIEDNLVYGLVSAGIEDNFADNTYTSTAPGSNSYSVRQNRYESDRSLVTIYNWQELDSVAVDPGDSLVEGDTYKIIDTQNYFGDPISTGTFDGSTIDFDMTSTAVATLIGDGPVTPTHTGQEFGSFMLVKTGDQDNDDDSVPNSIEDAGPNSGDGNGDGTADSEQASVATILDAEGDSYITLALDSEGSCTTISAFSAESEGDQASSDDTYNYPEGLTNFTIPCADSVSGTLYYHGLSSLSGYTQRKYGPVTPGDNGTIAWYDATMFSFGSASVGDSTVATANFTLTDGQLGDDTGDDDSIVDDTGPALAASEDDGGGAEGSGGSSGSIDIVGDLAESGLNYVLLSIVALACLIAGLTAIYGVYKSKKSW